MEAPEQTTPQRVQRSVGSAGSPLQLLLWQVTMAACLTAAAVVMGRNWPLYAAA